MTPIIDVDEIDKGVLPVNQIVHGKALEALRKFPDESIDCVITSPPYWGKRQYPDTEVVWGGNPDC
ncbi:MAG: hypothetical protein JRE40_11310, partial [Deltaproteobacteria bacterium]|nr:hypothetical protein [Deltaproteobacteria bacterium]